MGRTVCGSAMVDPESGQIPTVYGHFLELTGDIHKYICRLPGTS